MFSLLSRRSSSLLRTSIYHTRCFASVPDPVQPNLVQQSVGKHRLTWVKSFKNIESGPIIREEEVPAYQLSNNVGMEIKAMAQGGNMVQVTKNGKDYIWDNKEGACYYGARIETINGKDSFPLTRGLILHGGVRFAAVTAEHGLYYDTDWDIGFEEAADGQSKSIVMKITDNDETRNRIRDPLSAGQFNKAGSSATDTMTKYPTTNLEFTYTITLRPDEEFVRLNMKVHNPTDKDVNAEAWLPMTYPIEEESQIISKQRFRWRRDEWCFPDEPNIFNFEENEKFHYPLKWPSSGIFYDWPYMEGGYHAVNKPSTGQGVAYVTDPSVRHFIKLWSWGDKKVFEENKKNDSNNALALGRPKTEYYEPWGSAFNFGFFQTASFRAKQTYEWNAAILPIESGLTDSDNKVLQKKVEDEIKKHKVNIKSPSTMY